MSRSASFQKHDNPKNLKTASYKRLIVCCDGTGQDPYDSDGKSGGWFGTDVGAEPMYPSNVTRLARAIKSYGEADGMMVPQLVHYIPGVGTRPHERMSGGAFGWGLSQNVKEAYGFLSNNYADGDEIFFIGFSRGAYTARSICGLVCQMGLLRAGSFYCTNAKRNIHSHGMDNFAAAYTQYYENIPKGAKPTDKAYQDWKADLYEIQKKYKAQGVLVAPGDIKQISIGVFDTVGFQKMAGVSGDVYELPNTMIHPRVSNAFHAMALEEKRGPFWPTLYSRDKKKVGQAAPEDSQYPYPEQTIRQVWFLGDHSDVGGSWSDHELADISLVWMVSQFYGDKIVDPVTGEPIPNQPPRKRLLDFDIDYVLEVCCATTAKTLQQSKERAKVWAEGEIHDLYKGLSFRSFTKLLPGVGAYPRTPTLLRQKNDDPDEESFEEIHFTVRNRKKSKDAPWDGGCLSAWNYGEQCITPPKNRSWKDARPMNWTKPSRIEWVLGDRKVRRKIQGEQEVGSTEKVMETDAIDCTHQGDCKQLSN